MGETLLRNIAIIGVMGNALIDTGTSPDDLMTNDEDEVIGGLLGGIDPIHFRKVAEAFVREAVASVVKEAPTNVNEI